MCTDAQQYCRPLSQRGKDGNKTEFSKSFCYFMPEQICGWLPFPEWEKWKKQWHFKIKVASMILPQNSVMALAPQLRTAGYESCCFTSSLFLIHTRRSEHQQSWSSSHRAWGQSWWDGQMSSDQELLSSPPQESICWSAKQVPVIGITFILSLSMLKSYLSCVQE